MCRGLAIYFLAWFLSDLTYLPSHVSSFLHYEFGTTTLRDPDYWRGYYLMDLFFHIVRLTSLFFAVQWFYRAGPRIQAYLLAPSVDEEVS